MNPQQPDQDALQGFQALAPLNPAQVPPAPDANPAPVANNPAQPDQEAANHPNELEDLQKQVDDLRSLQNSGSGESALRHLRELLARPPALFDPYATVAALEALVDAARQQSTENASRYSTILKQTRPLASNPALQNVLIKLVGTEEEVAVAKEIKKALKAASVNHRAGAPYQVPYPAPRAPRDGRPLVCYWCGLEGHVMRNYRRRNRGGYSRGCGRGTRYQPA
ncbi:PREDICTED: uncharacterized protein LOC107341452 [Acropora digitifera]|uniref:uncharacterized protein LOC107341452 n=1 Tax=Acropora digitifera TaxID=70779 RepID=UPI00077AE19F|nr:PREDICTED: uncharacterized protein LOC107341452 [Acropora digitifera]